MCDVVTASILQGVGGLVSAYGAGQESKFAQNQANRNAQLHEYQARDAIARGQVDEQNHRIDVSRQIGEQRATAAAGNRDVNSGSALDVISDTASLGELDAMTIRANAVRESYGYKAQAVNQRNQSKIQRQLGRIKVFSALTGAGGDIAQTTLLT